MDVESLDILIVVVLVVGLLRGLTTGAVRQVVSFLGTIVAIVLSLELMRSVGAALDAFIGVGETVEPVLGFAVVFIAIQLALIFLVRLIEATIKAIRLGPVDRVMGGLVGVCKAALLLSVFFLVLGFFDVPEEENRDDAVLYHPVAAAFPTAWEYVAARLPYMRDLSERFGREIEDVLLGKERSGS